MPVQLDGLCICEGEREVMSIYSPAWGELR